MGKHEGLRDWRGERRIGWLANPKLRSLQRKIGEERGRSIDDDDSKADPMWVGWLVEWLNARATSEEELSFNMEYRLENRYSYTNEPKKRSW